MKEIVVIDFDGSLIDTLTPEIGKPIWKKYTGFDWPHIGWWSKPESLDDDIFDFKPIQFSHDFYKKSIGDKDKYVILATGRLKPLEKHVISILDKHDIKFHDVFLSTGGDTFTFKSRLFDKLIREHKPDELTMIDDRQEHLDKFVEWAKLQSIKINIFDAVKQKQIF